jgi:hypothetical protein
LGAPPLVRPAPKWGSRRAAENQRTAKFPPRSLLPCVSHLSYQILKKRFIADLVAADLLPARTDLIDEWLQAALALSIEIF